MTTKRYLLVIGLPSNNNQHTGTTAHLTAWGFPPVLVKSTRNEIIHMEIIGEIFFSVVISVPHQQPRVGHSL